ncbi:uncharacterized protein LOC128219629 [Mya arenaria]|uniref:uncharacterized protein LOC128219629 n=1 Tax=Mya arenaria TaxID=6604 RepID=UPI0022E4538B|nr:uncharacterized protein LOC128219629 [Mya arenaria]
MGALRRKTALFGFLLVVSSVTVLKLTDMNRRVIQTMQTFSPSTQSAPEIILFVELNMSVFQTTYSVVAEDFLAPTDAIRPLIPHIIHQTFETVMIPSKLESHIRTVVNMNANWTYHFWTDNAGRNLVKERHPNLLPIWDKYKRNIMRADALRYVVLYEFGGAYLDLDVVAYRSFNRITYKYGCIIPPEPIEHSALLYNMTVLLNNAIMFCQAKHPIMRALLNGLEGTMNHKDVMYATGPIFLTSNFKSYVKECLLNKSVIINNDNSGTTVSYVSGEAYIHDIHVANVAFFNDEIDYNSQEKKFHTTCKNVSDSSDIVRQACGHFLNKAVKRQISPLAFTGHKWVHLWLRSKAEIQKKLNKNISEILSGKTITIF